MVLYVFCWKLCAYDIHIAEVTIFFFFKSRGHWDRRCWPVDTNLLQLSLSLVIITAPLMSLPHHTRTLSIHLRAGRPGCLSPSTIPNNSVFNSHHLAFHKCSRITETFSLKWRLSLSTLVLSDFSFRLLRDPAIWLLSVEVTIQYK